MPDVFRLFIYAVVTLAVLWVFFAYLAPLFQPASTTLDVLHHALESAKASPGQAVPAGSLGFTEQITLTQRDFSQPGTDTVFECNNPSYCCDPSANCGDKAHWTAKLVSFPQTMRIPIFSRCDLQYEHYACRIFLGEKPPQITIQKDSFNPTLDLAANGGFVLGIDIRNTGPKATEAGQISLKLEKKAGNGQTVPIDSSQADLETLEPNQTVSKQFSFSIREAGDYQLLVRAESPNAGFEEKTIEFKAINQPQNCRALTQQPTQKMFDSETGLCTEKFFCEGCDLAVDCKQQWQQKVVGKQFEIGDPSFCETTAASPGPDCQ